MSNLCPCEFWFPGLVNTLKVLWNLNYCYEFTRISSLMARKTIFPPKSGAPQEQQEHRRHRRWQEADDVRLQVWGMRHTGIVVTVVLSITVFLP